MARCDLMEKTKLRFDNEGIEFAFPQLDLHINSDPTALRNRMLRLHEINWELAIVNRETKQILKRAKPNENCRRIENH